MTDAQKKKVVTLEGLKEYHDELSTKTLSGMSVGYASNAGTVNNKTVATNVPSSAVLQCRNLKHVLTHRIIYADFYLWEPTERPSLPDDYVWIKETDIDKYGIPRLIDIFLQKLNE